MIGSNATSQSDYMMLGLASSCHFWKELGNLDCIIISSDLSVWFRIFLYSHSNSLSLSLSQHVTLPHVVSLMSLSPSVHVSLPLLMFLLSLFPPPLKCRNPSTAFYQAFRPSRLRGSKPVNDRYELGCVYVCVPTKPDPAPWKKMSVLTRRLAVYGLLSAKWDTVVNIQRVFF